MANVSSLLSKRQKLFFKKYYEEMKDRFLDQDKSIEDMSNFLQRLYLEAKGIKLFKYGYKALRYVYSSSQIKNPNEEFLNELKNKPAHLIACITYLIEEALIDNKGDVHTQYVKDNILYKYFSLIIDSNLDYSIDYQ